MRQTEFEERESQFSSDVKWVAKELFYIAPDSRMMAVPIVKSAGRPRCR